MIKRLVPALMLAAAISLSAAPADAGPFRDKIKQGLRDTAGAGIVVASCVKQRLTGRSAFFCPR